MRSCSVVLLPGEGQPGGWPERSPRAARAHVPRASYASLEGRDHPGGRLGAGDILLFLTGQAEVDRAVAKVSDAVASMPAGSCGDLVALPLYAALPPEMQARSKIYNIILVIFFEFLHSEGPPRVQRACLFCMSEDLLIACASTVTHSRSHRQTKLNVRTPVAKP